MNDDKNTPSKGIVDAENLEVNIEWAITHYRMDDQGNFSKKLEANWGAKEIVNNQTWEIVKERIADAKLKVINGELSPIAYYMQKCITDLKTLSLYTGFSKWAIKRHMKPKIFNKLSELKLKKYCDFFEISLEEMKDIAKLKN